MRNTLITVLIMLLTSGHSLATNDGSVKPLVITYRWYWDSGSAQEPSPCFRAANDGIDTIDQFRLLCRNKREQDSAGTDEAPAGSPDIYENEKTSSPSQYIYQMRIRNTGHQRVTGIIWEYVFSEPKTNRELARHRFFNETQLAPGQTKTLTAISSRPPSRVITVDMLLKDDMGTYVEQIVLKRVTYADGSVWQLP